MSVCSLIIISKITRYHKGWMAQFTALVGLSVLTAPASFVNSHWYILCMVVPVLSVLTGLSVSYSLIPPILSVLTGPASF